MNDKKNEGKNLLDKHDKLRKILENIPKKREMIYREEEENNKLIGKPRFKEKIFSWPSDLITKLKDHLQEIWNFFSRYSYYFDNTIFPIIETNYRRSSKKSVIFLLEKDVWETDEVFGDYLIETSRNPPNKTQISYYRFNQKYKTFIFEIFLPFKLREKWIIDNAVKQIQSQFNFLWNKLRVEIESCIDQKFTKIPKQLIDINYINEQITVIEKILDISPESALLSLGRLVELLLLYLLNKEKRDYQENTINACLNLNLIDKSQLKLLRKINHENNQLKHTRYYHASKDAIAFLLSEFKSILEYENNRSFPIKELTNLDYLLT